MSNLGLGTSHGAADTPSTSLLLLEVVVTATRSERPAFETPQFVNVITDRMIVESNAGKTPDALIGEAGILVQKSNPGGGSPFIRGLTGKQVLILVDGVRLNNSYYRYGPHQYLNTIDLNDIDRIEIVHGPTSVLYGSDALGGVINVLTKRASYTEGGTENRGLIAVRGASADRSVTSRTQFEHSQEDLSVIGGVSLKRFGDLRGGKGVGRQVPTAYDEQSGNLKLSYRLQPNQEIVFLQHYLRQNDVPKTNEVVFGTKAKFNYEPQLNSLTYLEYNATDLNTPLFDALKFNLSYNRQKEGEEIIERAAPTIETRELTDIATQGFTAQLTKQARSQLLTYGLDYYHDRFETAKRRLDLRAGTEGSLPPGTPSGARYTTSGIYLQDEITLTSKFQLIPGVRFSRYKATGEIQGRPLELDSSKRTASVMGVYLLNDELILVSSLSQGYRAPNMEDFFGRVDFVSEIPNVTLRPETSMNREIGLKYNMPRASASMVYFYSTYKDLIARATVAPGVRQRQNLRSAKIEGFEASARYLLDGGWHLRAAVATTRGTDRDTQKPLQRIPPLHGSAHLRYTAHPTTWFEVNSVFARKQDRLSPEDLTDPRIPAGGTPGYGILNFAVGYRPSTRHELNIALENVANKKYKTHGSGVFGPGTNLVLGYSLYL